MNFFMCIKGQVSWKMHSKLELEQFDVKILKYWYDVQEEILEILVSTHIIFGITALIFL